MSAVGFALTAMGFGAVNKILLRFSMSEKSCPWAVMMISALMGSIFVLSFFDFPYFGDLNSFAVMLLVFNGMLWVAPWILELKAYEHLDASVAEVYGALRLILLIVAGVFLFDEGMSLMQFSGVIIIFGTVIISADKGSFSSNPGVRYSIASTLLMSTGMIIDKYLTQFLPAELLLLSGYCIPALIVSVIGFRRIRSIPAAVVSSRYLLLIVPALGVARYYAFVQAFAVGDVTTTTIIVRAGVVMVFVLEVALLQMREDLWRKGASCLACLIGTILVCA